MAAPAEVCAVVKADGYGHGAAPVARAALEAGAAWLAVAQVPEATELRDAAIDAPVLLLSEPRASEVDEALAADMRITVYTAEMVDRLAARRGRRRPRPGGGAPQGRHRHAARRGGAGGHRCAGQGRRRPPRRSRWRGSGRTARWPTSPTTRSPPGQLERFDAVLAEVAAAGIQVPLRHAANSAAAIAHPASRVRPRPLRHRRLRHPAGAGAGRTGAPRAGGAAGHGGVVREAGAGMVTGSPTGCATTSIGTRGSPRCPSATPTACSAPSASPGRRSSSAAGGARWWASSRWTR